MTITEINYAELKEKYPEIPIGKSVDVTNQSFGKLIPLYRTKNQKERTYWVCFCSCGNPDGIRPYDISSVRAGRSKSCGCLSKQDRIEKTNEKIIGSIINGWIIKKFHSYQNEHKYYECECTCNNHTKKIARIDSLKNGYKGCDFCSSNPNKLKDLTGKKIGHWTVLYKALSKNGHTMWHCQCDCSAKTEKDVDAYKLKNGKSTSCGCDSRSFGEKTVAYLLDQNNITYKQEYVFPSCKMKKYGQMRFDFYVKNKYLIEYDGEQHFIQREKGWNDPEKLKATQERDNFKNNWCKENNIPLIRIPYTHLKDLKIEDLLLETSEFIV